MSSEQVKHAIQLIKAGQSNEARLILLEEVRRDPEQENAWLWLATTMPSDAQRVSILKECLKYNPDSEMAQKSLEALSSRLIEPTFKQSDEIRSAPEKTPEKISPAAPVQPASRPVNEPVRRRRPQKQSGSCLGLILMFFLGLHIGADGFWAVERFILPPNTLDPKNTIPPVSTPIPQASPTSTVDPSTPTPTAVALPADSG
ncbi:MAG: hypothetical protein HGA86_07855, partial [Anaerolineaceae bacterium]|nr:hypothetical protein [Anaerolineaceae bacterium]